MSQTINPRDETCLHCWMQAAVEAWMRQHGRQGPEAGTIVIDVDLVLTKIGELIAEHIAALPSRPKRRAALKYAHDCVDAGYRFAISGERQEVVTPEIETEH